MPFVGDLKYEKIKDEESFVGRPEFILTEYFGYVCPEVNQYGPIHCYEGFVTDFASIPEWFFFLRPRNGKWMKASVIHDRACIAARNREYLHGKIVKMKDADAIFYYAMKEDEASTFTALFMWSFVRLNHLVTGQG